MQITRFIQNTSFPSGILEYLGILGKGRLNGYPPVKPMGSESLTSFADWQQFLCVATLIAGRIKYVGRELLEAYLWFPLDFSPCIPFSLPISLHVFSL